VKLGRATHKKIPTSALPIVGILAEKEGFEPSVPCGTHAFQACHISHSCISPIKLYLHFAAKLENTIDYFSLNSS
jgi:hypothetical protein